MKMKGNLTISRPQGFGKDQISITVRDDDAVLNFLNIKIDLAEFTKCLTGLAAVDCELETRDLEHVGKIREREELVFEMPEGSSISRDKEAANIEASKATPEGWEYSSYFNSQDSFFTEDGKSMARTSILRWIDKDD